MSPDILNQITIGTFTIASGAISSFLAYYFSQKSERKKRRYNKINKLKLWVSNLSIFGYMQSVEYYEIRNLMSAQEKQKLENEINIITSQYDKQHSELDADFEEWKKTWDMSIARGGSPQVDPLAYYSTMKQLMHKNYGLGTQENLVRLKEIMMTALCRAEDKL
jgi:hypothetical protein